MKKDVFSPSFLIMVCCQPTWNMWEMPRERRLPDIASARLTPPTDNAQHAGHVREKSPTPFD